jgi:hypothetical protein
MRGAILPLPSTPSWRGAQLKINFICIVDQYHGSLLSVLVSTNLLTFPAVSLTHPAHRGTLASVT